MPGSICDSNSVAVLDCRRELTVLSTQRVCEAAVFLTTGLRFGATPRVLAGFAPSSVAQLGVVQSDSDFVKFGAVVSGRAVGSLNVLCWWW